MPYGEEPPLPDVPLPGNFNVDVTDDDHPQILWTHYYEHEYRIERKIGAGSWQNIAILGDELLDFYIDYGVTIPDPKGRTIYYRMRGKVYDTYSDYTEEKIPIKNEEQMLPKKLADDNTNTAPLPQKFELLANYPNPFNSTTAIKFQLSYESHVTLAVYNITVQKICTLLDCDMTTGVHHVRWEGTDEFGRK